MGYETSENAYMLMYRLLNEDSVNFVSDDLIAEEIKIEIKKEIKVEEEWMIEKEMKR